MKNSRRFQGKTLLVLGSNITADDSVEYARQSGAHVIVADWNDVASSKAKQKADEALPISTGDFEELCRLVEERDVSGIFAGVSGFNLNQARRLCEKYDMPFYFTEDQWRAVNTKGGFRELCIKFGVPCPRTYYIGDSVADIPWEDLRFPVVTKPVDGSSSSGVFICKDPEQLEKRATEDIGLSPTGSIIVEEFVEGDEFTAHYTIHKGKATLSCVDNRYPVAIHQGDVTTIPVGRIFPSLFLDDYIRQVDEAMTRLCEGIGLTEGVLFIQGLFDGERFAIFEAGLRSAGEAPYRFLDKVNGVNYLHLLVDHALGVEVDYDPGAEDPYLGGKCCGVVSFVARGGVVGAIEGLEDAVARTKSVIEYESRYPVGSTVPDGDTLHQLMIRFVMICDSRDQMARDIEYLNGHVNAFDSNGNDMVVKMDPRRVYGIE